MGIWLSHYPTLASGLVAAAIGGLAWSGHPATLPLSAGLLFLVLLQPNRRAAYAVALAYYAASTSPLVPGANTFFGANSQHSQGVALWIAASVLLAGPWGLFHFRTWPARFWTTPLALAGTCLPPLGLIGWASPLTSAGMIFPGTGWLGILMLVFLPAAIVLRPRLGMPIAGALIAFVTCMYKGDRPPPPEWEAVDTALGRSELELPDPVYEFEDAEWIQERALNSKAQIIVFPETVVPRWNDATEVFWAPTLDRLKANGKTIILGTTIPVAGSPRRRNSIIVRGASTPVSFFQRVPVPISMWRPFSQSGFPLRMSGAASIDVAGQRAGVLICYELLLSWPVLSLSLERPTILIGVANDYWAKRTPIAAVQRVALIAWARLFRLPKLIAVNT